MLGWYTSDLIDLRTTVLTGGNIAIDAAGGNDTVYGSAGADVLVNASGDDRWDGAGGGDTWRVSGTTAAGFQGYDTYADTGTSGTDRIVAVGAGDVDIGIRGWNGTGIEEVDGRGAAGVVRLVDTDAATVIDLRGTRLTGGNVVVEAWYGNDTVYGSAGDDTVTSGSGNDWVDGGQGGDTYRVTGNEAGGWSSFHGYDTWRDSGTTGVDRIVAVGAGNVDIGVLGNFAAAGSGIEEIDGTGAAGVVRVLGDGSSATLDLRGATVTGSNVVLDAGYGHDVVYGSAQANTIVGGWGDDTLDGGDGADVYRTTGTAASGFQGYDTWRDGGASGVDRIVALGAGDVDIGFKGSFAAAGSGIEEIDATGAGGTVRLLGESGAQTLDFRGVTVVGSNVVIDAGNGNDVVYGTSGADVLASHNGEDTLDGAGGGDTYRVTGNTVSGFHGYDTYRDSGTAGVDRIVAVGTGDVDIGVRQWSGTGIEEIDATGAAGTVRVLALHTADLIDLRTTRLVGGNIVIDAASGNDTVYGSAGADVFLAQGGEDVLDGYGGDDTYRVTGTTSAAFMGHDTYRDSGAGGTDRIVALGTGNVDIGVRSGLVAASGIEVIDGRGAAGTVRVLGEGSAERYDLSGVTVLGANVVFDTGSGNDTFTGSAGSDTVLSGTGDDLLDGGEGGDIFRVTGNQAAGWSAFAGRDIYRDTGTTGIDRVVALGTGAVDIGVVHWQATGIEVIDGTGAAGTVRVLADGNANVLDFTGVTFVGTNVMIDGEYGNDTITGTAGADMIAGGAGDDRLDGADGGDTYRVTGNEASGWASFQGYDTYVDTGSTGIDRVAAVGAGDVDLGVRGWVDTGIEVIDGTGAAGTVRVLGTGSNEVLDFRGTTVVGDNVVLWANYGNDTLYGTAGADIIAGAAGDDLLDGGEGGDTYRVTGNEAGGWSSFHHFDRYADTGTAGVDRVVALGGGDVDIGVQGWTDTGIEEVDASGAAGRVRLLGTGGQDVMDFSATRLVGPNLVIDASWGNDTVIGSAGDDRISGSMGDDWFDGGEGSDTYLVSGVTTDGWRGFMGYDAWHDSGTTGVDTLRASGAGDVDVGIASLDETSGIDVIDVTGVAGTTRLLGTSGDDVIDLSLIEVVGERVVIDAGHGSDVIWGSAGDDLILAGYGADSLAGGTGDDTYRVGRGTHLDVIWDQDATEGNHDVIEFGADVTAEQIWFQRLDGFLEVGIIGTWDRLYLMDWDAGAENRIEEFRTADGRTLAASQVESLIEAMAAFNPPSIGQNTLSEDRLLALQPVIAAAWTPAG